MRFFVLGHLFFGRVKMLLKVAFLFDFVYAILFILATVASIIFLIRQLTS